MPTLCSHGVAAGADGQCLSLSVSCKFPQINGFADSRLAMVFGGGEELVRGRQRQWWHRSDVMEGKEASYVVSGCGPVRPHRVPTVLRQARTAIDARVSVRGGSSKDHEADGGKEEHPRWRLEERERTFMFGRMGVPPREEGVWRQWHLSLSLH